MAEKEGKSSKGKNAKKEGDMGREGESSGQCFQQKLGSSFPKKKEHVSTKVFKTVGKSVADLCKPDDGKRKINPAGNKST